MQRLVWQEEHFSRLTGAPSPHLFDSHSACAILFAMRAIDLIRIFADNYPQAEIPETFLAFLQEQERLGNPVRRATTRQPLVDFLCDLGVAPDSISSFLDSDSRLVLRTDYADLVSKPPSEINDYFQEHFAVVFSLQELVLDSEMLTGFNRHGRDHLKTVTDRMHKLLKCASTKHGHSQWEKSEAVIAGYLHDVGNLLSRKDHGIYGLYLLTLLFTNYDSSPETLASFLRIMEAVLFHEVEYGTRFASFDELSPITLSLIVADKTDVSFRRVSVKSNVSEAIQDAHMLVNLLAADSRVKCQKRVFQWEIHFSPTVKDTEAVRFPALLKRTERVWVPDEWQKLYRRENIEYVFIFHATFLRLYLTRLSFAVRAVFSLNPTVNSFRLVINDDERGVSLTRCFGREDYQAKIGFIYNNLFKNQATETNSVVASSKESMLPGD